jgi:hypothetical protein
MVRFPCRHSIALLMFLACLVPAQKSAAVTIYASPDGQDGYFEGARHQARRLSDILAALDRHPREDIVVQLTLTDPGAITTYRWRSENPAPIAGAGGAYEIRRFEGTPQARLIIRGVFENGRWLAGDACRRKRAHSPCRGARRAPAVRKTRRRAIVLDARPAAFSPPVILRASATQTPGKLALQVLLRRARTQNLDRPIEKSSENQLDNIRAYPY